MKIKYILFILLIPIYLFSEEINTVDEFYLKLMDLKNIDQPGYKAYNNHVENKIIIYTDNINDFYVKESNLFLRVLDIKTNKIFYTRNFSFKKSIDGFLTINEDFRLYPFIQISNKWSMYSYKNKISIKDELTNTNKAIPLYKITGEVFTENYIFYSSKLDPIEVKEYKSYQKYIQLPEFNIINLNLCLINFLLRSKNNKDYKKIVEDYYEALKCSRRGLFFLKNTCKPKEINIDNFIKYINNIKK